MSAESNAEFAKRMMLLAAPAESFRPAATYDPDGDCVEFLLKPDPFYGERVDDLVTVYFSQETGEVVGSLVKGVASFCKRVLRQLPGFRIVIQSGRIKLEHIFLARLWFHAGTRSDLATLTYQKLIQVADGAEVEFDERTAQLLTA